MVSDHGQVRGNYDGVRGNLDAATLGKVLNHISETLIGYQLKSQNSNIYVLMYIHRRMHFIFNVKLTRN